MAGTPSVQLLDDYSAESGSRPELMLPTGMRAPAITFSSGASSRRKHPTRIQSINQDKSAFSVFEQPFSDTMPAT